MSPIPNYPQTHCDGIHGILWAYSFHLLNGMSHAEGNIFIVQGDYLQQEEPMFGNYLENIFAISNLLLRISKLELAFTWVAFNFTFSFI